MLIGCGIFSIAITVELTHDFHTPLFIPGIVDGKLKMSFEVGEHGDIMTGGFSLASSMSASNLDIWMPPGGSHLYCSKKSKRKGWQ